MIASPKPAAISIAVDEDAEELREARRGERRAPSGPDRSSRCRPGSRPPGPACDVSRKYGSPRSELSPMTTQPAFQSSDGVAPSGGDVMTVCAFSSSAAGKSRTRSTGVTVSTLSGSAPMQKRADIARECGAACGGLRRAPCRPCRTCTRAFASGRLLSVPRPHLRDHCPREPSYQTTSHSQSYGTKPPETPKSGQARRGPNLAPLRQFS